MHLLSPAFRRALCSVSVIALIAACGSKSASQADLTGTVVDQTGAAVANATIVASNGMKVTTNATGAYAFSATAEALASVTVSSPNHATVVRSLPAGIDVADFTVRAYDVVQQVTLPQGQAAPLSFMVNGGGNTQFSLTVPASSLVNGTGAAASGAANIRITFWDPNTAMLGRPADLVAHSPFPGDNDIISAQLMSFGMFDISVEQNGNELQVASGQNLPISTKMPAAFGNILAAEGLITSDTYLWYLDPNTQAWRLSADTSFNANTGILTGALPHLSQWNLDNFSNTRIPPGCSVNSITNGAPGCGKSSIDLGGCIQGTILDKSGKPVTGKGTLWLFSDEGIYDATVTTDNTGHFCFNAGLRAINGSATGYIQNNNMPNFTSAYQSPDNSALPDPIPSQCKGMDPQQAGWNKYPNPQPGGAIAKWNSCSLTINSFSNQYGWPRYNPVVPLSMAEVVLCDYCPGTGPQTCPIGGRPVTHNCANAGGNNMPLCPQQLQLGSNCTPANAACCPAQSICADGQCVPATDTSVSHRAKL